MQSVRVEQYSAGCWKQRAGYRVLMEKDAIKHVNTKPRNDR